MAIYGDGKHDSDNTETSITAPSFTVSLTFECVDAKTPKEAVNKILSWIKDGIDDMTFDAENEITGEKFTVDLSEDEDNQVLPNNE